MRKIFDAHHHLWDLHHCDYPWLMAKGVKRFFGDPAPIQKNYLIEDFGDDNTQFDLVGSTHIQVGVDEKDAIKETQWLQALTQKHPHIPSAIVAFADLTDDNIENNLDAHGHAGHFRGIRQIIGRHSSEDKQTNTGALLANPLFLHGLKILEQRKITFDLQLIASQYGDAFSAFEKVPDLSIAICHFGSPWDLSSEGLQHWRQAMRKFSSLPHCSIKFSGFGMFKPDWLAEDIRPYVDIALELFGEERCMAGSNFPVDKLYGGYSRIWDALEELIASESILTKVTRTNAQKFYSVT